MKKLPPRRVEWWSITGASAGIGAALARVFAEHGHELVLIARRESKLDALADEIAAAGRPRPLVLPIDLTQPDAAGPASRRNSRRTGSSREYIVNNAGFGLVGEAAQLDHAEQLAMIDLNIRFAHRAVARLRRHAEPPARRHPQRRLGGGLHARPRHGGLLREQGLCAVVQRGTSSRAGSGAACG